MKVLAVYNIKGGVGKTASAVNLAHLCAAQGARTLVWDLDPQGAATYYFRVRAGIKRGVKWLLRGRYDVEMLIRGTDYELLDLLPADFSYRKLDLFLRKADEPEREVARLVQPLAGFYDFLFLDCAPSISLVSDNVFAAADALLVPTIPTHLSLRTLDQLRRYLARKKAADRPLLLPFFCMVDRRRSLHIEVCSRNGEAGAEFLDARIPYSSTVERMGVQRAPLATYAAASEPARAYAALWREVRARLERNGRPGDTR